MTLTTTKQRFAHICLCVRDIHVAMDDYRRILSVCDPSQIVEPTVFYEDFGMGDERLSFATFVSPSNGCEIQLMEPKTPGTALWRRLEKLGEHVHHICFTAEDVNATVEDLAQTGIGIVEEGISNDPKVPWQHWSFIDPKLTHGVLVEIANNYKSVKGKWEDGREAKAVA
jgi:methylmalonyl-CoA/ethylmalonyl-CoA epimerase